MSRPSTTAPVSEDPLTDDPATEPPRPEGRDLEQPFTGPLADLDRLARVAVGTVVVVFTGEQPPTLRQPGALLIPRLSPLGRRVAALPVTVRPVSLAVSVDGLGTADGDVVDHVEVRVRVRLDPADDHAAVIRLATEHGPSFGDALMEDVLHGVETAVRAAVGLNRSTDLRRQSLADLLMDHWMPSRLAQNTLLVESVTVPHLRWPPPTDPDSTEDTVEIGTEHQSSPTTPARDLLLSDDARLRRRWEQRTDVALQAVSTGRTTGARTALVVLAVEPDPDWTSQVAGRLADDLVAEDDTLDAVLVLTGTTYSEILASWFAVVAHDGTRLVGIDVEDDLSRLTVRLAPTRRPAGHDVPFDPHDPSVDALRQLLPFDLVTFEGLP